MTPATLQPRQVSNRCFSIMHRDPIAFYTHLIEDLERIAATTPSERLDVILLSEIKEAKEELAKLQGHYADADGLTLVPAIRKCSRCGKTTSTNCNCQEEGLQ
jgi:hypothetical protein